MTASTTILETPPLAQTLPGAPKLPGHYEMRGTLGEGGFGQVYEAWDTRLRRPVAIKCIKHAEAHRSGADLMREARLGASLRHAAFVKVHAIEDDGDTQSIVMEMVPGQTLKQVLAGGPVAREDALEWTRQIAEAMRDAHASGLVHGANNRTSPDNNTYRDVFLYDRRTNALPNPGTLPVVSIAVPSPVLVNTDVSVTASATSAAARQNR